MGKKKFNHLFNVQYFLKICRTYFKTQLRKQSSFKYNFSSTNYKKKHFFQPFVAGILGIMLKSNSKSNAYVSLIYIKLTIKKWT